MAITATALATSYGVMAWGENSMGQLGDGGTTKRNAPVTLAAPTGVTHVSAGEEFSLALLEDKTVDAWGENYSGQ
ncbi:MAG TPA: hypothetical protein VES97_01060, partial [Solirubrobacteraceae bacterium]|nr:hypothetical protein [Solirubrobacteraceae bacterium]